MGTDTLKKLTELIILIGLIHLSHRYRYLPNANSFLVHDKEESPSFKVDGLRILEFLRPLIFSSVRSCPCLRPFLPLFFSVIRSLGWNYPDFLFTVSVWRRDPRDSTLFAHSHFVDLTFTRWVRRWSKGSTDPPSVLSATRSTWGWCRRPFTLREQVQESYWTGDE